MMKKLLVIIAAVMVCGATMMSAVGCDNNGKEYKYNVVCTIFPAYDFARAVIGDVDDVGLTMLLSPGSESHAFQATPKQMLSINKADLFIYNGGESDHWIDEAAGSLSLHDSKVLKMMECIDKLYEEEVTDEMTVGEEHEEENEDEDTTEYDEHVWTSPVNAAEIVREIRDKLIAIAPEHAESFRANAAAYIERINGVDELFRAVLSDKVRNTVVFADKFPARYFVEEYDLDYLAAYPGCANEVQASPATLLALKNAVNEQNIPVVFYIELSNQKDADAVCGSTNAQKREFHTCHNLTKADFDSGKTYIDFMTQNAVVLREALC